MEIKISVIIPIYNLEKYLARCLESIIHQTLENIEIICVNDGSTDGSASIAQQYAENDKRIIVIHQENKGQSAARNAGIHIAKGKYISFIDGDDWIDLDFLEKLYNAAESHNADAACAEIKRTYASGKNLYKLKFDQQSVLSSVSQKYKILEIPGKCYVWNKIYRRNELIRQNLLFKEGVIYEDIHFITRFFFYCKNVVTVPGVIYHYWSTPNSSCRTETDKNQIDKLSARADFIKFSREHHIICDEKFYIKSKTTYKLFGIPLLKIYEWETIKKYYLFALIPFFEKRLSL